MCSTVFMVYRLSFQQRFRLFPRRLGLAAEHAGEFGDVVFAIREVDLRNRAAGFDSLDGDVMGRGGRSLSGNPLSPIAGVSPSVSNGKHPDMIGPIHVDEREWELL